MAKNADSFVDNVDNLRHIVYVMDGIDEGSSSQALWIVDHADQLQDLIDSAQNILLVSYELRDLNTHAKREQFRTRIREVDYNS